MTLFAIKYSAKSDEELMLLLCKKEQHAFEELYARYSKPMLNYFARLLNFDKEKSQDMLHDLFLKIIENPQNFNAKHKFSTWFYALASNMIKNEYKWLQIRQDFAECELESGKPLFENNKDSIDQIEFLNCLNRELSKLDIELRTLFTLRFFEEKSIKEIAGIMDCPEGTIKSRLFYLVKNLSKQLQLFKPE